MATFRRRFAVPRTSNRIVEESRVCIDVYLWLYRLRQLATIEWGQSLVDAISGNGVSNAEYGDVSESSWVQYSSEAQLTSHVCRMRRGRGSDNTSAHIRPQHERMLLLFVRSVRNVISSGSPNRSHVAGYMKFAWVSSNLRLGERELRGHKFWRRQCLHNSKKFRELYQKFRKEVCNLWVAARYKRQDKFQGRRYA